MQMHILLKCVLLKSFNLLILFGSTNLIVKFDKINKPLKYKSNILYHLNVWEMNSTNLEY